MISKTLAIWFPRALMSLQLVATWLLVNTSNQVVFAGIEDELDRMLSDRTPSLERRQDPPPPSNPALDRANIPNISINATFIAEQDLKGSRPGVPERPAKNNFDVREVEFGFSSAVDHLAHANVLFAMHRVTHGDREGEFIFELHEAFVELSQLPFNSLLRVGKMHLDAGRLNTIHPHDRSFTHAPVIHEIIFNDREHGEGASDIGAEFAVLTPVAIYQELKLGVFRGRSFGHNHGDGHQKKSPLITARLKNFFLVEDTGIQLGLSYLRYNATAVTPPEARDLDHTVGVDLTVKRERGRRLILEWSTEFWYKEGERMRFSQKNKDFGFYTYFLLKMWNLSLGLRHDQYERSAFANPAVDHLRPFYQGQSVWIGWHPSEFSLYRISLDRHDPSMDFSHPKHTAGEKSYTLSLQTTFMMGYHPPHRY